MVAETICVMFYTDKRYIKLVEVAKNSFLAFNHMVPVFLFTAEDAKHSLWLTLHPESIIGQYRKFAGVKKKSDVATVTQQNITFLADDVQIEPAWGIVMGQASGRATNPPAASVSDFVDPTTDRFARFLGTTDASESIREPSISEIHHVSIYSSHDAYIDFDRTVAIRTATPLGYYLAAGIDYRINLDKIIKSKISFVNAAGTDTPTIRGYVTGF